MSELKLKPGAVAMIINEDNSIEYALPDVNKEVFAGNVVMLTGIMGLINNDNLLQKAVDYVEVMSKVAKTDKKRVKRKLGGKK